MVRLQLYDFTVRDPSTSARGVIFCAASLQHAGAGLVGGGGGGGGAGGGRGPEDGGGQAAQRVQHRHLPQRRVQQRRGVRQLLHR